MRRHWGSSCAPARLASSQSWVCESPTLRPSSSASAILRTPTGTHVSFCLFAGPLVRDDGALVGCNAVTVDPGKIDRSPTGTGVCARMAMLHARGQMQAGHTFIRGRIEASTRVSGVAAVIPSISGRAWITGLHDVVLDPDDPWPGGYRIGDTRPMPETGSSEHRGRRM